MIVKLFLCAIFCLARPAVCAHDLLPHPCESEIYCHGPLLRTVQMNHIYPDSKTFVDMKMKYDANTTMQIFKEFMAMHQDKPERNDVENFVNKTFDPAGSEFEDWVPSDWKQDPSYIEHIKDADYKGFAKTLNDIWKDLGRKMKDDVKENEHLYSIIWVPNPVIVPGGRFREFYYWDSYWIIQGLLHSEMFSTAKGMLSNFAYIINEIGHIPNGGRIYYKQRSQPPLYIPMVKLYVDATEDFDFIRANIATFEKEFKFWKSNHSRVVDVDGKKYTLLAYGDYSAGPRPESYSEDVESAEKVFKDEEKTEQFYSDLKAAAESGWDFSSRWFIVNGTNNGNLTNIKTRSIIPVDLNAIFHWNAIILAEWHELLNNSDKATYYRNFAAEVLEAVEAVLWHEEIGTWLDYDMSNSVKRDYFFPSNLAPLWTGCFDKNNIEHKVKLLMKYLDNMNVNYPGGIPTSRDHTGEQWDFPNAWPPLQHMIIVGLNNTGVASAKSLAFEIADKWVRANYKAHEETENMYEKYDATILGGHGGGGEYNVQLGFGWTNGVVMDLLHRYGDKIFYRSSDAVQNEPLTVVHNNSANKLGWFLTAVMALIIGLMTSYLGFFIDL